MKNMKNKQGSNRSSQDGNEQSSAAETAFKKLFEDGLKDIYWVEKALTKAIPKMIKKTTSDELVNALEEHLTVTEEQVKKVERVFEFIGKKPMAKKCPAMEGILKEGEETMAENEGMVRDAGIICSAQKVEHYEIASYGSLCAFANTLGMDDAANLLKEILEEEKKADETLTKVAESSVNMEASTSGGGKGGNEEDEEDEEENEEEEVNQHRGRL
jgi:ferritin-like metal-binding protein YciE